LIAVVIEDSLKYKNTYYFKIQYAASNDNKIKFINASIAIDSISRTSEMTLKVLSQDLNDEIAELITNESLSIKLKIG
jgi:hypothetical protein